MDALLMCGGQGTRLRPAVGDTEKPLVEVDGRPMVDRVVSALHESRVSEIVAAVSPETPSTAARLTGCADVRVIETAGGGSGNKADELLLAQSGPRTTIRLARHKEVRERTDRAAGPSGEQGRCRRPVGSGRSTRSR